MGIVFSQLAVAAYACPELTPSAALKQMKAMNDMAGMPCADAGMLAKVDQPALCAQHCDQGNQTVGAAHGRSFDRERFVRVVVQLVARFGVRLPRGDLSAIAPDPSHLVATRVARNTRCEELDKTAG